MDSRDERTWVVLDLTRAGELQVEMGCLESTLRKILDVGADFPIFVPSLIYKSHERVVTLHLMEGYAFVASGLPEVEYFKLERTPYVGQVMSVKTPNGMRALSTIRDSDVDELRVRMRTLSLMDLKPGDRVRIMEGKYRTVEAEVLDVLDDGEKVLLRTCSLSSLVAITVLPKFFLASLDQDLDPSNPGDDMMDQQHMERVDEKWAEDR